MGGVLLAEGGRTFKFVKMNPEAYFKDLSTELQSVQNRVRHLIGDAHWPSDGAWKESALRSIIRGYLPSSVSVGTGFVLTPNGPSTQIDILIYDDTAPVLFRDGDFVVITPDSVRAVVEVKTSLSRDGVKKALTKLSNVSHLLRTRRLHRPPFIGLFCYTSLSCDHNYVLDSLKTHNGTFGDYEISALVFGDSQFYRFWRFEPGLTSGILYESWHAYELPKLAPGYFIHNIVEHLYPQAIAQSEDMWYPIHGKEIRCIGQKKRKDG